MFVSNRLALLLLAALATSVMAWGLASPPARAATLTVTNTDNSGVGSLRQAMIDANADAGEDVIDFDLGSSPSTIALGSQLPVVTAAGGALTIDGDGEDITVSGQTQVRVFEVGNGANLALDNLTVASGGNVAEGGGLYNEGTLELNDSTLLANVAAEGGGVYNEGTLEVSNSTIDGDDVFSDESISGGGVYNAAGSALTLIDSTIRRNHVTAQGGGVYNGVDSRVTVLGSTFFANSAVPLSGSAAARGGGVYNEGTLEVSNSTFFDNVAYDGGAGLYNRAGVLKMWNATVSSNSLIVDAAAGTGITNDDGQATLWNTIMDAGYSSNPTCSGAVTDGGNNIDTGASCGFGAAENSLSGTDPLLGDLQDNGGPTGTMALQAGSPAIDKGNDAFAVGPDGNPLPFDQRGQGFARIVGPAVDIGAFEVQQTPTQPPPGSPPPDVTPEIKQECKKGGYEEFGFKNQGLCIKAFNQPDKPASAKGPKNPPPGFDWNNNIP